MLLLTAGGAPTPPLPVPMPVVIIVELEFSPRKKARELSSRTHLPLCALTNLSDHFGYINFKKKQTVGIGTLSRQNLKSEDSLVLCLIDNISFSHTLFPLSLDEKIPPRLCSTEYLSL